MATALLSGCGVCHETENLQKCTRCTVMRYCGREHQAADFASHKRYCALVAKCRNAVDLEEQELRSNPDDDLANVFEEDVGHFWKNFETRTYMQARYAYIEALQAIKSREPV